MAKEKELEKEQEKKSKNQKPRVNVSLDEKAIEKLKKLASEHKPVPVTVSQLVNEWIWNSEERDGLEQENEKLKKKLDRLEKKLAKLEQTKKTAKKKSNLT